MEQNFEEIELENGSKYLTIDKHINNGIEYLLLVNSDDKKDDIAIVKNVDNTLSNISNEEEFNSVLEIFFNKNKDLLEKSE